MQFLRRGPWMRFSLRTLFVAITALCCWLGWESSAVRGRRTLRAELEQAGFEFITTEEYVRRYPPGTPVSRPPSELARVSPLRTWLGDEPIEEIWYAPHQATFSQDHVRRAESAFPEAEIREAFFPPCHPGCFPSGTLVETASGPRRVEAIQPGDAVLAVSPNGKPDDAQVQSVFTTQNRLWRIETEAGNLLTTETQPLCRALDETAPAGELQPGDTILVRQGDELCSVRVLTVEPTDRVEAVFNLVLGNSEIFVANGFLARSKPPLVSRPQLRR